MNHRPPARAAPANGRVRWPALELQLPGVSAVIDDNGAWSELLTCWLWEIAAESVHNSD